MTYRDIAQPLRTKKNIKYEKAIKVKRNGENMCFFVSQCKTLNHLQFTSQPSKRLV